MARLSWLRISNCLVENTRFGLQGSGVSDPMNGGLAGDDRIKMQTAFCNFLAFFAVLCPFWLQVRRGKIEAEGGLVLTAKDAESAEGEKGTANRKRQKAMPKGDGFRLRLQLCRGKSVWQADGVSPEIRNCHSPWSQAPSLEPQACSLTDVD